MPFEIAYSFDPTEGKKQLTAISDFQTRGSYAEPRIRSLEDVQEKEIELISY